MIEDEIFFHLDLIDDENIDIDEIKNYSDIIIEDYVKIGDVSLRTKQKSLTSSASITSCNNGEDSFAPLVTFIERIGDMESIIRTLEWKCLYVSYNYSAQCNFELDSHLLAILSEMKISLAISGYFIEKL